ncbi:Signal transduction histidine kinase CheA [Citrifermentans bremense]|uniref:histidine kinase n=1 Tax=Citrifermentans bremense TaxID=60035 RepID=A0A6S6M645_9BACT|nr:response regulator [Citrifermentans bremense]BCG47101.1 Signal transduction histidine kinase CheA [Citrifermentans bremense]
MGDTEALMRELLDTFELEAQEHVGALATLLVALERENEEGEQARLVETVLRRVHTLKGAAHAVNLVAVAQGCQELETLLASLKRGELALDLDLFDRLHRDIDAVASGIAHARASLSPPPPPAAAPSSEAAPGEQALRGDSLSGAGPGRTSTEAFAAAGEPSELHAAAAPAPRPAPRGAAEETVKVSARLLESLLLQSEELVSAKLSAAALHEEIAALAAEVSERAAERSRALEMARKSLKQGSSPQEKALAQQLEQGCQNEKVLEATLRRLEKGAEKNLWALRSMIDPLLDEVKKLHLLPFSSLADPFSKMVRDLARQLGKEAELHCEGSELELDRRILAELKEPLLHLVRNMLDHGIEAPAERRRSGKPEKGKLRLEMKLKDGNRAELSVSDDGCGIDLEQVREAALRQELAPRETLERTAGQELLQFIFESGVSTSRTVSSISGRGVGLAIVREALERLGGHVAVESAPGAGTRFRLYFPLSFAMMRALQVQVAGRDCFLPAAGIEKSGRVAPEQVKRVENRDTVLVEGEVLALVPLARLLGVPAPAAPERMLSYVLLHAGEKRIACAVDQVVGVQEILVKPLGSQLSRVRNVAGGTMSGDGKVVPVLSIADLFRSAFADQAPLQAPEEAASQVQAARLSVLVAEDSITSRTLLKNILEASGYRVRTAIDGLDALTQLKTEPFDVVVSDVEMPRMDGFQLTAAIRADGRFTALPVILVTGLESRADRERGIDVGASAYLVKSSFDQSGLIDVIRKLT